MTDVTSKGDTAFNLVITGVVETTPAGAHEQFFRINECWLFLTRCPAGKPCSIALMQQTGL
jgi:hypothetical protein